MGLRVKVPIVNCYSGETEDFIEISECNVSIVHFKITTYDGLEIDKYIKREDLKTLAKVF